MKKQSLYELIGELRGISDSCRFLSKQLIVNYAVNNFNKLLISKEVVAVCQILRDNFNDAYTLDENIELAIDDYLNK